MRIPHAIAKSPIWSRGRTCPQVKDVPFTDSFEVQGLKRFSPETSLAEAQFKLRTQGNQSLRKCLTFAGMGLMGAFGATALAVAGTLALPIATGVAATGALAYAVKKGMDGIADTRLSKQVEKRLADADWKPSPMEKVILEQHFTGQTPKDGKQAREQALEIVQRPFKKWTNKNDKLLQAGLLGSGLALATCTPLGMVSGAVLFGATIGHFFVDFERSEHTELGIPLIKPDSEWQGVLDEMKLSR